MSLCFASQGLFATLLRVWQDERDRHSRICGSLRAQITQLSHGADVGTAAGQALKWCTAKLVSLEQRQREFEAFMEGCVLVEVKVRVLVVEQCVLRFQLTVYMFHVLARDNPSTYGGAGVDRQPQIMADTPAACHRSSQFATSVNTRRDSTASVLPWN